MPNLIKGAVRKVKSLASCYVILNFKQATLHKKQNICKIFGQQIPLISKKSKEFVDQIFYKYFVFYEVWSFENLQDHNMKLKILPFLLLPLLGMGQTKSKVEMPMGKNTISEKQALEIKRNALYNLEEIKVRWKKAALENCPGVPCPSLSAPGPCSSIVATPTGPTSASVSFVPPTSDGGSPITGYIVTATSTPSAPAKRKTSAAIITVGGTSSPIVVTDLVFGVNYIFSVLATNAVGPSPTITTTTVTPCVLNTASAGSSSPTLTVNTALTNITHTTTSATGIGTATGLPAGVNYAWSGNVITISGTPSVTGTFNYTIPLTGTSCSSVNATGTITVTACGSVTSVTIDGYSYPTVSIGTQCWTKENLKVTKYNDGTPIDFDASGGANGNTVPQTWGNRTSGAYTIYANESSTGANATNSGFLYNWYAATDSRKLCPTGWHVPTDSDWNKLVKSIDSGADTSSTSLVQSTNAGGKLKSTSTLWNTGFPNLPGTDNFGFTALPGGWRNSNGIFDSSRDYAYFMSVTESNPNFLNLTRILSANDGHVVRYTGFKELGISVRCLRD